MSAPDWQNGGFGLYLHWPFCQAKCPYCDFNSHVSAEIDQAQWQQAYLSEISRAGHETDKRTLNSVFFGGGTPSLMSPDVVAAIIENIRETWPVANDLEITLEANPTSVEAGRFDGFRDAGVTRISMGIQALNDPDLKALGRLHSVKDALEAFDIARSAFERVSFDLIYARQHQSLDDWRKELRQALSLAIDHLSLYQLTIEDGTAFGDRHRIGRLPGLPTDDLGADMYDLTQELCDKAGFPAYEVSNHAADLAQSRHNLIYWRCGDYLGIGPGAHGRLTFDGHRFATETARHPIAWLDRVAQNHNGELDRVEITAEDQAQEYLLMSLRLTEGTNLERFAQLNASPIDPETLNRLCDDGFLEVSGHQLKTTSKGRPVLNAILRELLIT
ncbi:radical SAM family heme chaperone HemW [Fontisubflavum oceani]|uniref:radical SAM family heme chaperone HemW n=1 Tax=Fontisubflavum oceani TaxID=2978973 RepID=UPI0025B5E30C|nr:radical SAM family heme chaperone HemW [Fontisubflavum oceani]WJY22473.1 radical SAM family heme chaperone HemW [Fontisubflavum oceani]